MHFLDLISAAQPAAGSYGTSGLTQWIKDNIVTLLILLAGSAILWAARGGNMGKGITIGLGVLVGISVLGLATGTTATDVGDFIVSLGRKS